MPQRSRHGLRLRNVVRKFLQGNKSAPQGKKGKMENELMLATEKWLNYECEYILPSFGFAEAIGFDLRKAVSDSPGKNFTVYGPCWDKHYLIKAAV